MIHLNYQEIRRRLNKCTVGIAGAGGLGSGCAVALARTGVGRLVVADFDFVSLSNLNRQYYFADQVGRKKVDALRENIARIDPGIKVDVHHLRLDPENIPLIFEECSIIVEAFDNSGMKKMIAETVIDKMPGRYLVMGNGVAGFGNNEALRTIQMDNLIICGDNENEVCDDLPPLAPRVGIVSHMQANKVLELLLTMD